MNEAIGKLSNFKGAGELGEKLNQLEEVLKQAKMAPFAKNNAFFSNLTEISETLD